MPERSSFQLLSKFRPRVPLTGRKRAALAAFLVATGLLIASASAHLWVDSQLRAVQAEMDENNSRQSSLQTALRATPANSDFVTGLPHAVDATRVASLLQVLASSDSLTLVSLSVGAHPGSPKALPDQEWTLTVRGTYPNIKALLAKALEAVPGLRLQDLALKRLTASDLEAQVVFVQWLAPVEPALPNKGPA